MSLCAAQIPNSIRNAPMRWTNVKCSTLNPISIVAIIMASLHTKSVYKSNTEMKLACGFQLSLRLSIFQHVHIVCVHCTLYRSTSRWLNFHSKLEFGILTRCIIKQPPTCINPRTVHFSGIFCRRLLHWFINGPFWFWSCAWDFTKIEMNIFFIAGMRQKQPHQKV